jgi:glyoxylate/hydroxypyruvate reductase A
MRILLHCQGPAAGTWHDAFVRALPEAEIVAWTPHDASAFDYAIVYKPGPEQGAALARVKAVFNLGAGVDPFLAMPALPASVTLVRLEDAGMAEQMAEYAAYAVLRVFRDFPCYAVDQRARRWSPRRRADKAAFRVGVLGLGVLGQRVAATLAGLGFPVLGWSRGARVVGGVTTLAGAAGLRALLPQCRVVIALLPHTPETAGLLNRDTLSLLPAGAWLVNLARGALVVEPDLLALLDEGRLGGAMLDVFVDEPLPADHPFWHHPRIEITPHVSGLTLVEPAVAQVAAKIRALARGLPVTGVVDRERRY